MFTIGTETYYSGTYYFINDGTSSVESINSLTHKLNISFDTCIQMIKSFNGTIEALSFFNFTSLEDAEKALDWVNSLLLIGKLSKSK